MKGVGVAPCRRSRAPGGLGVAADEGVQVGVVRVEQGVGATASLGHEPATKHHKFTLLEVCFLPITPTGF